MNPLSIRRWRDAWLVQVAVVLVSFAGSVVVAGPNRDGALIFHIVPEYSTGEGCDPDIRDCAEAVASAPGNDTRPVLVWLLAAFPSSPRVAGLQFGIDYSVSVVGWGSCADFTLAPPTWPGQFEGLGVTWTPPIDDDLFPVCWFSVYGYDGTTMTVVDHPQQGSPAFADDAVPSELDEVEEFGVAGFGVVGYNPCLIGVSFGACCLPAPEGGCTLTTEAACEVQDGVYLGDDEPCQDYLCAGVCCINNECVQLTFEECEREGGDFAAPARRCGGGISCIREDATWGEMKHVFRDN